MPDLQKTFTSASFPSRLDPAASQRLAGQRSQLPPLPGGATLNLPQPIFPQKPELLNAADELYFPKDGQKRKWKAAEIHHAMKGWMYPYFRSRILPGEFHPLIAYLFNEWKCNLDCQYCWAYDNQVKGMTEEVARRSIDWLHTTTCRVLALMGGEVLLRPDFAQKIVYYAAKQGFWIYLPTNGRLMKPDLIDRMADAGVATFNLAVDAWDIKPGLPKAMVPIRKHFEYLIRKQYKYGFSVFLNINICRNNLEDVRMLTELAHDNGIATDYHICETPMMVHENFHNFEDNQVFIREEDHGVIGELIDWLVEKQNSGWQMVNSVERLLQMKTFIEHELKQWDCRAGLNSLIIRVDGTLAPCFPTYSATYDWGTVENPKMDESQLKVMKQSCESTCFSTLNHILAFCYNDARVIRWLLRQAAHGFQGVHGNME
ncbi:MAG TPA: radical SAM protein [Candidatus Saccharimonadales bacterium]|nr:radical SAM protein [Candidatus Saccharimonadales bacterium]